MFLSTCLLLHSQLLYLLMEFVLYVCPIPVPSQPFALPPWTLPSTHSCPPTTIRCQPSAVHLVCQPLHGLDHSTVMYINRCTTIGSFARIPFVPAKSGAAREVIDTRCRVGRRPPAIEVAAPRRRTVRSTTPPSDHTQRHDARNAEHWGLQGPRRVPALAGGLAGMGLESRIFPTQEAGGREILDAPSWLPSRECRS